MNVSSKRNKLSYIPTTEQDRAEMLQSIGAPSVDTLFEQIPAEARLDRNLRLPPGLAEQDVVSLLEGMAARNKHLGELTCFLGAGAYDHFIPSVVDAVISRSEFFTAYTPYQPEASQGVLQSIFEYQSMVAALTQMEVSNASLYDAGTALGEAIIMAHTTTKRNTVLVSRAIHP
ncbi:MAG TPA: glycine dehydrogenase, partial [Armatimonadota bacterium]|nr:glycine dehydrogenase [Armatimonadota bacterium]